MRTVEELVKTERLTAVPLTDSDYCQIRTSLLLTVCPLKSPVWIRLSAEKYVKLFTEGDEFNREDHEKLTIKKGVEYLYIRKNDIGEFISKFQADLTQLVNRSPPVTAKEIPEISEMTVETFQELGKRLGFEKAEVQEIAKSQVQMAMNVMGKTPGLNQFMELLKGYQGQYISSHSTLCGFMACSIAAQMQWGSDITFRKLSLASFLHDIVIDKHDLAAIRDVQELEASSFTPEQKKQYMNHPIEAAEIAKGFSEVPPDVDVIIAQHHERPDGKGFPRGLGSSYIAPLAAIFIVAHEMARYSLDKGPTFKAKDFLDASRDKYSSSQFKKVMAALEKLSS